MLRIFQHNGSATYLASCLLAIAFTAPVVAQDFHFGVKAGVPITEYVETRIGYSSATTRYLLGVSAEYRLKPGLDIELDVLYRHIGFVGRAGNNSRNPPFITDVFSVMGSSWEFPLMVKYRIGGRLPVYVTGGGVLRYIGPVRERGVRTTMDFPPAPSSSSALVTTTTPINTFDPPDLRKRVWPGLIVGEGLEFKRGRLRVLPELRYTRWTSNIGPEFLRLRFQQNQAEFLLGFLF